MEDWQCVLSTPIGTLGVVADKTCLHRIDFLLGAKNFFAPCHAFAREVVRQLDAYFLDPTFIFDLPVAPSGTSFQRKVWSALKDIPMGETRTYGTIAKDLSTSPRAVGNTCRNNPLPIIVPCHRVVGKRGPGGFSGKTQGKLMEVKAWLLDHERRA